MREDISESNREKLADLKDLNEKTSLTKTEIYAHVKSMLSDPNPKTPTLKEMINIHVYIWMVYFDNWIKTVTIPQFLKYCALNNKFLIEQAPFKNNLNLFASLSPKFALYLDGCDISEMTEENVIKYSSLDNINKVISFNIKDLSNDEFITELKNITVVIDLMKKTGFLSGYHLFVDENRNAAKILGDLNIYGVIEEVYNILLTLHHIAVLYKDVTAKRGRYNWVDMFNLGFVIGSTRSISHNSFLLFNESSQKLIHSAVTSALITKSKWEPYRVDLEKELLIAISYAKNKWRESKEKIYHNEMADKILKEYPKLSISKGKLIKILSPIAKTYRYSDFVNGEFGPHTKIKSKIKNLCLVIDSDKYNLGLKAPEDTIEKLNEIIMKPNFYDKWKKMKGNILLSKEVETLVDETNEYRKEKYDQLDDDKKSKIKRLNRLLLEHTYPRKAPKSLKHGLMRGWEGTKKEEHY